MADQIHPEDAARALAQIRDRQGQVIDVGVIPIWYWWLIGGLIVLLAAAVESTNPATVGIGVVVFVLGVLGGTGLAVRRALRVQIRNDLLGARGILLILGFVALTVAASLAVAFGLDAAGVPYPAALGNLVAAILLVVGGPLLMRALRRVMLNRRAGGPR